MLYPQMRKPIYPWFLIASSLYDPVYGSLSHGVERKLAPVLLAEFRFYGKQNVDSYLGLLEEIDVYYNELLEFEKKKAEEGLFMSDRMADKVVASCRVYLEDVEGSLLDEAFQERLEELPEINGDEKAA